MNLENFKIILCPTADLAKLEKPIATVEAEYGDICIEGELLTLAHHGSRSNNPAPCNALVEPLKEGTIVVSHLDLDTIGGIMAITGDKPNDVKFWEAAEYIDVNGIHHMYKFEEDIQNKLNATYAWADNIPRVRYTETTDVTQLVKDYYEAINIITNENHPEHKKYIETGTKWAIETSNEVESRCILDSENVRAFKTDGVFCNSAYYSKEQEAIIPCIVSFNEKFKSITVSFEDGGKECSARELVQELWGPEAGGRDGIAGSPRGVDMTDEDLKNIIDLCMEKVPSYYNKNDNGIGL